MYRHTHIHRCTYTLTSSLEQRREEFVPGRGVVEIDRWSAQWWKERKVPVSIFQWRIPPLFILFCMPNRGNILFKIQTVIHFYVTKFQIFFSTAFLMLCVLSVCRAFVCECACVCTCTSPRLPERPDGIVRQSPWQKWINQTPLAHLSLFGGLIGKEAGVNRERREPQ